MKLVKFFGTKRECLPFRTSCMQLVAILLAVIVWAQTPAIAQQNVIISGVVIDSSDEPVIGATVTLGTGSSIGTITDYMGLFSLTVPKGTAELSVSYLGFQTQNVKIGTQTHITIVLQEDTETMEEVVVIAYGTQSKLSATGAMSNVRTDDLVKVNNASVTNALAGNMTGVSSVQAIGQPGAEDATLYIRGSSTLSDDGSDTPLILVDGVERSFSSIDPNEIADITVLKDAASTAVFGVRGANGVILVTTRRGSEGRVNIAYSSNVSIQTPTTMTQSCDSYTTAMLYNEQLANDNNTSLARFSDFALESFRTGSDPIMYPNTDWRDLIFKDAYAQTQHNVNISGGTDRVRYFTSLGYIFQDGLIKQFDTLDYDNTFSYNNFSYRANLDIDVTKTTLLSVNLGGTSGTTHQPIGHSDGLWRQVSWAAPYAGAGLDDEGRSIELLGNNYYPVALKTGLSAFYGLGYTDKITSRMNMDVKLEQDLSSLLDGLKFHVKGAYNTTYTSTVSRSGNKERVQAMYAGAMWDGALLPTEAGGDPEFDRTIVYSPTGNNNALGYSEGYTRTRDWYLEGAFNYNKTFEKIHRVSALLLYNQNRVYYPSASSGTSMTYQYIPRSYLGLVGRASYGYDNKYLVDVNVGYNGSENFAPGKTRFGLFPSGSLGWVVSEEEFMKHLPVVSFLKLRASYGIVGNDKMGTNRFLYMPGTWTVNQTGAGNGYNFGVDLTTLSQGASEGTLGNDVVTWETAHKQNYGIDFKLFDNRLSSSVDIFYEHRSNILIALNTPPDIIAATLPLVNLGEMENKGYEVELRWNDKFKGGNYYIGTTLSYAKNKVLYMDEVEPVNSFNAQTGRSTGMTYGYVFDRFYTDADFNSDGSLIESNATPTFFGGTPKPGDCKYVDMDGDGDIDADDRTYLGYSTSRPEYTMGFNYGVNYKGWTLSMQWLGATNVSRNLSAEYRIPFSNSGNRALYDYHAEGRWTYETAETATMPRFTLANKDLNMVNSSLWVYDASYLRLKNMQIGYTFKDIESFKKIGLRSLFVYASGYNLLTFDYIGFLDPESNTSGGNSNQYPINAIYTLGVKLNF